MTSDRHHDSEEERNQQLKAEHQAESDGDGLLGNIKTAFRSFAQPFVTGDTDLDNDDQADLEQQRDLNDEESRR
ncbi:MAG TPA: hypothetical protein VFI12_03205 [Thermomicrobiales bacterium]|jgi:hypothetical protein|nr:hypothetical protein [Thermomicrobiales bacterium]